MALLTATFDTARAQVDLVVDGSGWTTVPATVTITHQASGGPVEYVRGFQSAAAGDGYLVTADTEMDQGSSVTYVLTGYDDAGTALQTASAVVDTSGAAEGVWIKVPGTPRLTCRAIVQQVGDITSVTVGGVYQIMRAGTVAQVSESSGVGGDTFELTVLALDPATVQAVRDALGAGRTLLLQQVTLALPDFRSDWWFVSQVTETLAAQVRGSGGARLFTLAVTASSRPSGDSVAASGWTWADVAATYATWADVAEAFETWFALAQG